MFLKTLRELNNISRIRQGSLRRGTAEPVPRHKDYALNDRNINRRRQQYAEELSQIELNLWVPNHFPVHEIKSCIGSYMASIEKLLGDPKFYQIMRIMDHLV